MTLSRALQLLHVDRRSIADPPALKAAFLRQAMQWHPDVSAASDATQRFQQLNEALNMCLATTARQISDDVDATSYSPATSRACDVEILYTKARLILESAAANNAVTFPSASLAADAQRRLAPTSLERVAFACSVLTDAVARTNAIAAALPKTLCGGASFDCLVCPTDDAFHALGALRALEELAPRLVARLVKVLPAQLAAAGLSNTDSACDAFKPLVLIGRICVDVGESQDIRCALGSPPAWVRAAAIAAGAGETTPELCLSVRIPSAYLDEGRSSRASRIRAALDAVVPEFTRWQQASVLRLVVEQRTSAAVRQLSRFLGLVPLVDTAHGQTPQMPLQIAPCLSRSLSDAEKLLATVEMFAAEARQRAVDAGRTPSLLQHLRGGGGVEDTADPVDATPFVESIYVDVPSCSEASHDMQPAKTALRRSSDVCRAEEVRYAITVTLAPSLDELIQNIVEVLKEARHRVQEAFRVLPDVLAVRGRVQGDSLDTVTDELLKRFAPVVTAALVPAAPAFNEGHVRCFARLYGMETAEEGVFWEHVARRRGDLVPQQAMVGGITVRLLRKAAAEEAIDAFGWVGRDAQGSDEVTLSPGVLQNEVLFDAWLDDVMLQCCLSRQAEAVIHALGLRFIVRDPTLPLPQFVAFLHRFKHSAARSVFQAAMARGPSFVEVRVVPSVETLTVGELGHFRVPWDTDPGVLVAVFDPAPAEQGGHPRRSLSSY